MAEVLNLHFDGTDGSTTITDSSASAHVATVGGNAQLDTAEKTTGTASLKLDGSGDYISYADSADWEVSTNDWEITGWFRLNALGSVQSVFFMRATGNHQFVINVTAANKLAFHVEVGGAAWGGLSDITGATTLITGIWYYFKLKKISTAITLLLSSDRATFVTDGTGTVSGAGPTGAFVVAMGCGVDGTPAVSASSDNFNGWIDEFVFNNGATTADVVPPTQNSGFFLVM